MGGAAFWASDLEGASFRGADLRHGIFWNVNLKGAFLEGADLRGANDLTCEQIRSAVLDENTELPAYLVCDPPHDRGTASAG